MLRDNNKKRRIVVVGKGGSGGGIDQVQSDWNQTDNTQVDYIKNKPNVKNEWFGTKAEYDLISPKDPDTIYYIEGNYDLENLSATANGTYQSSTKYGYDEVTVNVQPNLTTLNATANGTYTPTSPVQGYSSVTVNVGNTPVDYFYVEDASGQDNTLTIQKGDASTPTIEVFYSTDQTNWSSMGSTSTTAITATVPANGKLYLKAIADKWGGLGGNRINCSGQFKIGGCIMSLLYGDNFADKIFTNANTYAFDGFFGYNGNIIGAEDLVLPNNTMDYCYHLMFYGAENLVTAPALPATTLAERCYSEMFVYCIRMTTAPALPATALAKDCYRSMFSRCLFTTAPALPAPVLVNGCYSEMFKDCTNLTNITTYANNISASNCLSDWVNNVAATGDFYNLGAATYSSGASGIPTGWTEHNSL